jgi:hypothetical protein
MTNLTNMKLPVGLVAAIVAQAMGLAVWINTLQGEASNAQATAVAAQERVTELEDRLAEAETGRPRQQSRNRSKNSGYGTPPRSHAGSGGHARPAIRRPTSER